MKMIVEANPLLTIATGSANSIDASSYYKTLDLATYEQRRSAHNLLVAQTIKPDYLLLQTEPTTDAVNSQNPALSRVSEQPEGRRRHDWAIRGSVGASADSRPPHDNATWLGRGKLAGGLAGVRDKPGKQSLGSTRSTRISTTFSQG